MDTELYHNPRAAVASRRARSQPPQPLQVTQSVYRARASVPPRGVSPPPRSYVRRANREVLVVVRPRRASVSEVDFRKPVTAGWYYPRAYYNPVAYPTYRYIPRRKFFVDAPRGVDTRSHYAYGSSSLALPLFSRLYYPKLYSNEYVPFYTEKNARARVRVLASPLPYKKKFARKVTSF